MSTSAVLIYNPRAGSWRTAQRVAALGSRLASMGFEVEPRPTDSHGHATELARQAAASGVEVVFAHGGDGTLREAAAGLLGSRVALAPIPGGTVNVVATALGLPQNPLRAVEKYAQAKTFDMDVGRCGDEIFLMQASAGLDAHIMGHLDPVLKRRFGRAAVAYSGLRQLPSYDYPSIDLVADGRAATATLVAVCNLPYYAGSFQMAPGASVTDGLLDLVLFRGSGRRATLAFGRDLALGRHLRRDDVDRVKVQTVELRAPEGLAVQLDGDTLPIDLPVTIDLHPRTVRILEPEA